MVGGDPQLAAESSKQKTTGLILKLYEKTQLFWVALVLADLVIQATKTAHSIQQFLDLLRMYN